MDNSNPKSSDPSQTAAPKNMRTSTGVTNARPSADANPPQTEAPRAEVPLVNVEQPTYPQSVRDAADAENLHRNLNDRLAEANKPKVVEHRTPPIPEGIKTQMELEKEAGRKMNEKFAANEAERQRIIATRKAEAWEGQNQPVFRPNDYVPDPKKNQGHNGARSL